MKKALIGYTGFVGSNLNSQIEFTDKFNSENIAEVGEKSYDLVICAAPSAVKWKANQEPEQDYKHVQSLIDSLQKVRTKAFIQISTIDVYTDIKDVDENTKINPESNHAYGKHRYYIEEFVRSNFKKHLIVRLPALFGPGLKKNFIFDLLNNNALNYTDKDSEFQFYNLENLWHDIELALKNDIKLINLVAEPIKAKTLAKSVFNLEFENKSTNGPVKYDIKTIHARLFSGKNKYIKTNEEEIKEIISFVNRSNK
jgi:nucleoside-diphosphate-sugar epimerase